MDERPRYFVLLILSIVIASSIYVSWATDRARGRAQYESKTLQIDGPIPFSTTEVSYDLYLPYPSGYFARYPLVLTIHGLGASKESMYAYNIELARRNFTVVSVDLPGHGLTRESFEPMDALRMAEVCYSVLEDVWQQHPEVDNSTYGIIAHSMGVGVAFAMADIGIAPSTIVAIGSDGDLGFDEPPAPRCNLLLAVGSADELVSNEDALRALRIISGNSSAIPNTIYGSFASWNATELVFGECDHLMELVDPTLVSESLRWMIVSMQGEHQLNRTTSVDQFIYPAKTYGTVTSTISLFLSIFPVLLITNSALNRVIRPNHIHFKDEYDPTHASVISLVGGLLTSPLFVILPLVYVVDVNLGTATLLTPVLGMFLSVLTASIFNVWLLRKITKSRSPFALLERIGIQRRIERADIVMLLRGILLALISGGWIFGWVLFANNVSGHEMEILFPIVRVLTPERLLVAILLFFVLLPYALIETIWVRGFILQYGERSWGLGLLKRTGLALTRPVGFAIIFVPLILFFTLVQNFLGTSIMMLWFFVLILALTILSPIIIAWMDHIRTGPWTPIFTTAMLWAWVLITIVPLP